MTAAVRRVKVLPAGCLLLLSYLGQQAILNLVGPPTKVKFYRVPQGVSSRWGCWELGPPTGKQTAVVAATGTATAASVAQNLLSSKWGAQNYLKR